LERVGGRRFFFSFLSGRADARRSASRCRSDSRSSSRRSW